MRYVCEVKSSGETVPSVLLIGKDTAEVTVRGAEGLVEDKLGNGFGVDCIGSLLGDGYSGYVAYNEKSLALLDYLRGSETLTSVAEFPADCDEISAKDGMVMADIYAHDVAVLTIGRDSLYINDNGVASIFKNGCSGMEIMSLWSALVILCKRCGFNVLTYKELYVRSEVVDSVTKFVLDQSGESLYKEIVAEANVDWD